jgi:hypothetical protein
VEIRTCEGGLATLRSTTIRKQATSSDVNVPSVLPPDWATIWISRPAAGSFIDQRYEMIVHDITH